MKWSSGISGFNGKPLSWSRLERILSGKPTPELKPVLHVVSDEGSGGNVPVAPRSGFAELHARGSYNFLLGASEPDAMVAAAIERGIEALALLDRDGLYGAMAFAEAAASRELATVFGAELTIDHRVLSVLCKNPEGYRRLSRLISAARMRGDKDTTEYPPLPEIARHADGHWYVLADHTWEPSELACFGDNVILEYVYTMTPEDADNHRTLDSYPGRRIATSRPSAATPRDSRLAAAKHALYQRESLDEARYRLHPAGSTWLRIPPAPREQLDTALDIAAECSFPLHLIAPGLPHWTVDGVAVDEQAHLRALVESRFDARYGASERADAARTQIAHELAVIEQLGFPGYFLIVCDIVDFCKAQNILAQGRGSAANSAVCYTLGITNAEPIAAGLLFERFLSPERDGPPDIDIDIESGRREEVIQYVYAKYGRENAAQVANYITYRRRGAVRDAARALGYPQGVADAWARRGGVPARVEALAEQFIGQPRHLGIHSGGMVICDRAIADVVPVEWARMENRSVVQWDKEGCAAAGLVKFDLLGLGMLEALHHMIDLVAETGREINLWEIPLDDPAVYDMLCRGDAVGVFQVESRAQLATLPRLKPRCFFDLVVEVALIRPGPIQGGSVHPYLRRRNGEEPVTYEHPLLEAALAKTLGVPLFQEQLMHLAVDAAGFSGGEADELRRAMGAKRSPERMTELKGRFYAGLARNGIKGSTADALWNKVTAFAAYGFPESHAQSFASIVYFSAWFKHYYPAQFCVGLLRAQPMGFYSPESLLHDARRHGVTVLPVDINRSQAEASIEDGAIRLGLNSVRGLARVDAIVQAQPFRDIADLARRAELTVTHLEALARAGALGERRQALWQAGVAATEKPSMLPGLSVIAPPALPGMSAFEMMAADVTATGITHTHPIELLRAGLDRLDVTRACDLLGQPDGARIRVAGVITHRQRPATASGVTFLGMEDETGLMNVVVSVGLWRREALARTERAVIVRGIVQNANGVAAVVADKFEPLPFAELLSRGSRDFR
ncbi:error-prone DNA polymerase [Corynebacterium sp. 35RC1]|nr:error-prone DNA polymerase [Corynebacterium sp. 35RC1]